jgi:signal transduction histidine kinase
MKRLHAPLIYALATGCLLASLVGQLAWVRQVVWAEHARLRQELENQVSTVAEQAIMASLQPQTAPLAPYREFFLSPGWRQLRVAYYALRYPMLTKQVKTGIAVDSMYVLLGLSLPGKPAGAATQPRPRRRLNSYLATYSPQQLARIDRQSLRYLHHALDSLLQAQHVGRGWGYRLYEADGPRRLAGVGAAAGRFGYASRRYAYNDLHLRVYQLVVPSLASAVLYRLRYTLTSAGLLLLLTGATFGALLRLLRGQRRYAEARLAFINNVTHELKTPVATVALALESITKFDLRQDPARLQQYVAMGQHELRRLTQLIENVLALDQAENDATSLRAEVYDVQEGLHQAIAALRPQLAKQGGHLVFHPAAEPCLVVGDPVHLANVCYNLLENALKHGGAHVRVQLSCGRVGTHVQLSFQDNGPGIAKAYHTKIFRRFFRVPGAATALASHGTGLGLHYVKQIVAQHHGTLTLRSAPGQGSEFIIRLYAA